MDSGNWCLVESDPAVMTQLIRDFGAIGVLVEEMWSLDEQALPDCFYPLHGLIFLFKYVQHEPPSGPVVTDNRLETIYFAKQVINNACATQALISLLLNCKHPHLILGPELTKLKEFSMSFDPMMRGLTLSNSQTIRAAHNSMAQQTLFEFDPQIATKDGEAFHYIGYMPIEERLYELDGLRDGPIDHGPIPHNKHWLDIVRPIIKNRMNRYAQEEIKFSLLALISDKKDLYQRQLHTFIHEPHLSGARQSEIAMEVGRLRMLIDFEKGKERIRRREMARRKHNYLPFIIELLKILSEEKKLMPLLEQAKERACRRGPKKIKI